MLQEFGELIHAMPEKAITCNNLYFRASIKTVSIEEKHENSIDLLRDNSDAPILYNPKSDLEIYS